MERALRLVPNDLTYGPDLAPHLGSQQTTRYEPDLDLWLIGGYVNVSSRPTDAMQPGRSPTPAPVTPLPQTAATVMNYLALRPPPGMVTMRTTAAPSPAGAACQRHCPTRSGAQQRWGNG